MRVNGKKIIQRLETLYPKSLAEAWDNVGLILGNENRVVERILICLEVTEGVLQEAIDKNIDMIIAHHPLIFKGLKQINEANPHGKLIAQLIRENILVYCMHTNYDIAPGGLNDILAKRLNLHTITPLNCVQEERLYKLAVYVPEEALDRLQRELFTAGAGRLGHYENCGFSSQGVGTFKPLEGAAPYKGQVGDLSADPEIKWETVVASSLLSRVIETLHRVHPYETPAYDVFPLETPAQVYGLGRVGLLEAPESFDAFIEKVKAAFEIGHLRFSLPKGEKKRVYKVALVSGAGMDYVGDAISVGADVFITGDMKYHEVQAALDQKIALIDVGHFESEVLYKDHLKVVLDDLIRDQVYDLVVLVSEVEEPVFQFA